MHHQRKERASDTLENVAPNQSYQRFKGLKEWHFGLFEGESVYLFDNLYKPEDLFEIELFLLKERQGNKLKIAL